MDEVEDMKNKEKYAKEIVDAVTSGGYGFGFNKSSGEIRRCNEVSCDECLFCESHGVDECNKAKKEWAESEYVEKPVISKRDRAFLEYLREDAKWMTKENGSEISVWMTQPNKDKYTNMWTDGLYNCLSTFNIDFPMVKLSDSKPWLIEDLKKLEVVENYE
jgi:hypothetical protein